MAAVPKKAKKKTVGTIDEEALRPIFDVLRQLRLELAQDENIPPFGIFSDATLWAMAQERPHTLEEMSNIKGVGAFKLHKYGPQFIEALHSFE